MNNFQAADFVSCLPKSQKHCERRDAPTLGSIIINMKLAEKFGGLLGRSKFENGFKNALKRQNFHIVSKESDCVYEISNGSAVFKIDISEARRIYEETQSDEELDKLINRLEMNFAAEGRMVSFTNGQEFLRLMIMREQDVDDTMISADFVEGLKKVVVYTPDDEVIHNIDDAMLKRWGVPKEVVLSVADRNMCRILSKAEIGEEMLCGSIKTLDIKIPHMAFCSSLILCNEFRSAVYERLGSKFLVVAPSRESLLVLKNITNDILEGLGTVILSEFRKAKNPLTTDVLLYTPKDIQIAGHFSIGRDGHVSTASGSSTKNNTAENTAETSSTSADDVSEKTDTVNTEEN